MTSLRKDTRLNEAELLQNSTNWNRTPLSEKSNTPARALFKGDKRLLEKGFSASTGDITKKDKSSTRVVKKDIKYDIIPKEKYKASIKDYGRTTTLVTENNKAVPGSLSANQSKSRESFVTEVPQKNKYTLDNEHKDDSSISVAVRLRPFSSSEVLSGHKNAVSMNGNVTTLHSENDYVYDFNFDHSLWSFDRLNQSAPYVSQEEIFQRIAKPLLNWSLDGYNTCLFAYGQTGSGKSYTMMGYEGDEGIIPRFSNSLFQSISAGQQRCSEKVYSAQISFFEIYNEKIFDLLSVNDMGKQRLCVREHPDYGPYVQGLALHNVGSHKDTVDWLEVGNKNRATASTGMNDKSSRSHSVFTILLSQVKVEKFEGTETQLQRSSKINLIDLAGSERVTKVLDSDAVKNSLELASARMKEGSCINKSLHTLGKVISLLSEISSKKKATFIPYRDSVLTWLLKESLGGNAKTTMLATIAPSQVYASETLSTLRYAHQARSIVNKAKINEDRTSQLIREMLAEIKHLKAYQRRSGCNSLEKEVAELRQKLKDAQGELALTTKNWQEDIAKSNVLQKTAARNLRQSGVAFGKVENQRPSLVNLNEDPQLAEILLYLLNDGETLVGGSKSMEEGNIILNGNLVADVHCALNYADGVVTFVPFDDCASYVNGEQVTDEVILHHGDRIVIGGDHFFRFNHPKEAKSMQRSVSDGVLKDFNFAKTELQEKQNQRLEDEIEQARLDAEELAMNKIREAQIKAEESILLQKRHFEEQLLMLQKRLDASNEEKHQAVQEEQNSKEIITQLKSQQKHLEEQIASNRERLQIEADRARQVFEETKSNQKKIIEELELQRKKIEDDINKLKSSKEKVKVRSSILVPVNEKGDFDLLKISMLIREANEISKRLKQHFIFSRDDFCLDGEVQLQIRVKDTQKCQTALMTLEDFNEELILMREQGCFTEGVSNLYKRNLIWERDAPLVKKSSRLSVSNDVSDNLIESLNKSMEMSAKRYDELFSFQTNKTLSGGNLQDTTDNEICKMNTSHTYLESSRLSSVHVHHHATKSEETICDNTLRASFIDSMLDECEDKNEVSIMSSLIQRIFQIYVDYNTQAIDNASLVNMACSIKSLKISASMLCSVHEAVGLDELKKMCRLFRKLVTDAAACFKSQASEITFGTNQRKKQNFNKIIMQLVEVLGALSLGAVDHVSEEDNHSYFSDESSKNLSKHFLEHQNKFLVSMFNEAESTVQNGIKDIRYLQINASHEMSDDLVDDVMNILTSCTTLLNRGKDFMMVYADVCVLNSALYYAKECFILRKILASLVDLNENIQNIVQHSASIAKNVDNLEEFIELPIELADTTKCLCRAAEQMTTFASLTKHLDEEIIVLLQDCFDKFEFASKAVRVGATILVQEIEKDMNVSEEQSVVSFVQSDVEFKRNQSLCPLNRSRPDLSEMEIKLQSKLRWDRRSSVSRDMFISRYMDSNDDSELSQR